MNKKGLILIFLFVVSTVGFVAISNAATDNKIDVTINYVPSGYIDQGYCWVEFDPRFIDDNTVVGQNDDIYFAFYYDVAVEAWFGAEAPSNGNQPDAWFYADQNNWTAGYTGDVLYNETRFAGYFEVTLDGYALGTSNFDISGSGDTYQSIDIALDVGWHYLAITAAELVSDGNHTEWYWDYAYDSRRFYVGENKDVIPPSVTQAYFNWVNVTANAVNSEDLPLQGYTIEGWLDNPRPIAEADITLQYQTEETLGTDTTNVTVQAVANYNASDAPLGLAGAAWGVVYSDIYSMGPHTYMWRVNNLDPVVETDGMMTGLNVGQNYVYLYVFGGQPDDIGLNYGHAVPRIFSDVAVFNIWIGPPPAETGFGFGILISVSILGLAAALYFVRRRK